jgi:hypothetical protein
MINATGNTQVDHPSTTNADDKQSTPHKPLQPSSATPRIGNKTQMSTERTRTGMAKKLEMSFVDESVRYRLMTVGSALSDSDSKTAVSQDEKAIVSPARRKFPKKSESDAIRKSTIVSPSRIAPTEPDQRKADAITEEGPLSTPDTEASSTVASPIRLSSPRKVTRALSDKVSSIRKTIETLSSPRNEMRDIFDGLDWEELSDMTALPATRSTQPPLSPSYLPPQDRKRKADADAEKDNAKRVRFNEANSARHFIPDAVTAMPPSSAKFSEIDRLSHELEQSPIRLRTAPDLVETEPKIVEYPQRTLSTSPLSAQNRKRKADADPEQGSSKRARLNEEKSTSHLIAYPSPLREPVVQASSATLSEIDRLSRELAQSPIRANATSDEPRFPFTPNRLGQHAIKARQQGKSWIGKASGNSVAGRLQAMLDQLMQANPQTIHLNACVLLQQLFGLLPAGANKVNKAFNYAVSASFYSLGFTAEQWMDIEMLYQDFDTLTLATLPDAGAEFKAQLKEIIAAKNGLVYLKQQVEASLAQNTDI